MIFKENNKAIYLQIVDKICDDVVLGTYVPGQRLPSVRESAASVQVNANTVMRSYEYLSSLGVIYNKRGIGFFVADDACGRITDMRRKSFLDNELPEFFHQLRLLGFDSDTLKDMYQKYCDNHK